jgi:glycerol 3-phosphatase-2
VGLIPVDSLEDKPAAVVQGFGPDVGWKALAEASLSVRAGAYWMATNADRTLPSGRGPLPGNGSLVAVLRVALDREPDVIVGKPEPALFSTAAAQAGAQHAIVVGDRLDTDIEGAVRAGMDSLLVLSGISDPLELLSCPPERRPTYVANDVTGLFGPGDAARVPAKDDALAGWRLTRDGDQVRLEGSGEPVDALRLLCGPCWDGVEVSDVRAGSDEARELLTGWKLPNR